jgi:hypothetical protein
LEVRAARLGHPSNFWSKSFNMCFLFAESVLRHEHGEVTVLDTDTLEEGIQTALNVLPNVERERSENIAT